MTMLEKVKLALRVVDDDFNGQITDMIYAACADLGVVGVTAESTTTDPLLTMAIITYCKMHWNISESEYEKLKASYDEQKAQLISCTGYGLE